MMQSKMEFCQACQMDLQTALEHTDLLEESCTRNKCPFTVHLDETRKKLNRQILEVRISPNPILEGFPFNVQWYYKGDLEYLKTIKLKGYGRIERVGTRRFKAIKEISALVLQLTFRDKKRANRNFPMKVHPHPQINLLAPSMRVKLGSSVKIQAKLEHVGIAEITDENGNAYEFTRGVFETPPVFHDQSFKISARGLYGTFQVRTFCITVFDPPAIEHISTSKKRMKTNAARLHFHIKNATSAVLTTSNGKGKREQVDLSNVEMNRGFYKLKLIPGEWSAHIVARNHHGDSQISDRVHFDITETTVKKILNMAGGILLAVLFGTIAGLYIHWMWTLVEFIWQILEFVLLEMWVFVKLSFYAVRYLILHPLVLLVVLFFVFLRLREIGYVKF